MMRYFSHTVSAIKRERKKEGGRIGAGRCKREEEEGGHGIPLASAVAPFCPAHDMKFKIQKKKYKKKKYKKNEKTTDERQKNE